MDTKTICECGHSKDNHGIQSGCAQCQCVKSQSSVMVDALTTRIAELEAALRSVEWGGRNFMGQYCPSCGSYKHLGHCEDCEIAPLLAKGKTS
jgi:hypothetical protein